MRTPLIVAALAVALSGCSSMGIGKKEFTEIQKTETGVDKVPTWYVEPQADEGTIIYGSGTGLSDDLQFSMDKAIHEAKLVLADKMSSEATADVKRFISDNAAGGQSKTTQKTQKVSKTGFKNVNVSNYDIVNRSVFKEKALYRTYILIKLNTEDVDQLSSNTFNSTDNNVADQAFTVLDSPQINAEPIPNNGQFLPVQ